MSLSTTKCLRLAHRTHRLSSSIPAKHFTTSSLLQDSSQLEIQRIAGSLGAIINNIDLRTLTQPTINAIRHALLTHKVIFFRNQNPFPAEFLSFASHFGQPLSYPFVKGIENFPTIIRVLKREDETTNFGGIWHSDTTYLPSPPMGTLLLGQEIPPYGGDTLFANQAAAYEALSPGLKKTLDTLTAVNTSAKAAASKTREDRIKDSSPDSKSDDLVSYHPVVRTHPETGEKVLYVNVAHTEKFEGWTADESAPLLEFLHRHQVRPEFTCRFAWEVGSIAFWDNRAVSRTIQAWCLWAFC